MKKVLIPFSGGLDSTFCLYKNLLEGNKVVTAYFEITNNENKVKIEREQRDKILTRFESIFNKKITDYYDQISVRMSANSFALVQPPIWLLSLFSVPMLYTFDEIHMSYVVGDHALSYLEEIKQIYDSLCLLSYDTSNKPELKFPIIKYTKEEIIDKLPQEILDLCYSCENPSFGLPCGNCHSCDVYKGIMSKQIMETHKIKSSMLNPNLMKEKYGCSFRVKHEPYVFSQTVDKL